MRRPARANVAGPHLHPRAHAASHLGATIAVMPAEHFSPWRTERHLCWHCVHYERMVAGGAQCRHPHCCRLRLQPKNGCSRFVREPGADDEAVLLGDAAQD